MDLGVHHFQTHMDLDMWMQIEWHLFVENVNTNMK